MLSKFNFLINIKYRTTLLFLVATLSIIIAFIFFFYTSTEKIIHDDYNATLRIRNNVSAQLYLNGSQAKSNHDAIITSSQEQQYIFELNELNLEKISDSLILPLSFIQNIKANGTGAYIDDSQQYVGNLYQGPHGEFMVISYAENYFNKHVQNQLRHYILICLIVSCLLTLLISYYLSKSLFKPITKITNKVKEISSQNLHLRLEEERQNPELNQLIQTFNQMLNRIETSFESQNNFISNASHELRTPLTSIMGVADVCLSKPRTIEEYTDTLGIILHEADKLDQKTKALLSLAQTGFKGKAQKFEPIRIDELMWECIDTVNSLYQSIKINYDMSLLPGDSTKLIVVGNAQLLLLAFTNIIVNAHKYSDNELVTVSIAATQTHIIIAIRDKGIGIPKSEIPYIYDPFYRCSNTKQYEGYGIGLPLTKNIVNMHNGQILIDSAENKGTVVEIRLPIMLS